MNHWLSRHPLTVLSTFTLVALGSSSPDAVARPVVIFDGSSESVTKEASASESRTVKSAITPGAKRRWTDESFKPDFRILSKCKGSFSRVGVNEVAYLYSWCEIGHIAGISGLAIMQQGKVVAHFGWEGRGDRAVVCLPDLNGDGLNELAIVGGDNGQGHVVSNIAILALRSGNLKNFGRIQTYSDNSGAVEKNAEVIAWKISTNLPASKPTFWQQKFKKVSNTWVKSGKLTKSAPEKDDVTYEKL